MAVHPARAAAGRWHTATATASGGVAASSTMAHTHNAKFKGLSRSEADCAHEKLIGLVKIQALVHLPEPATKISGAGCRTGTGSAAAVKY